MPDWLRPRLYRQGGRKHLTQWKRRAAALLALRRWLESIDATSALRAAFQGVMAALETTLRPAGFSYSARRAMKMPRRQSMVDELLCAAVQEVRRLTGFDRVMA